MKAVVPPPPGLPDGRGPDPTGDAEEWRARWWAEVAIWTPTLQELLSTPGLRAVEIAASKDPNPKVTILLLPPEGREPAMAVKVPLTDGAARAVDAEEQLLSQLHSMRPGAVGRTIPQVLGRVDHAGRLALVTTALPGASMATRYHRWRHTAAPAAVAADFGAASRWLDAFQRGTAGGSMPLDLDGGVLRAVEGRFRGEPGVDGVLDVVAQILGRLRRHTTARTAVHGDFWFGNVLVLGSEVSGVADWEAGTATGQPARDLVRFALTYALYLDRHTRARHLVAGHPGLRAGAWGVGIRYALDGSGWFPSLVRRFLARGLERIGAPGEAWRDAALAGLAEVAATADDPEFALRHLELLREVARPA